MGSAHCCEVGGNVRSQPQEISAFNLAGYLFGGWAHPKAATHRNIEVG